MESISSAELAELVILSRSSIDMQFSLWLTITFALMTAAFATKETLLFRYKVMISVLYFAATLTLLSRGVYDGIETASMIFELKKRGIEFEVPFFTIILRSFVVFSGTIAGLIFVILPHSKLIKTEKVSTQKI